MSLTPEQKQTVAAWVAAGDNLSTVQQKLTAQFKISLTYRDVRFLVDDLNLELKDPAPKVDASDVSKAPPTRPAPAGAKQGQMQEEVGQAPEGIDEDDCTRTICRRRPGTNPPPPTPAASPSTWIGWFAPVSWPAATLPSAMASLANGRWTRWAGSRWRPRRKATSPAPPTCRPSSANCNSSFQRQGY